MKRNALALLCFAAFAVGCATAPSSAEWIRPTDAIRFAADAAPGGVAGVFALQVKATGEQAGMLYLNSEDDYRDQRNLTVAITPAAARQLEVRLGAPPHAALAGQHILVRGHARRVQIAFFANGAPTDKYYYQTHVQVTDAGQVEMRVR